MDMINGYNKSRPQSNCILKLGSLEYQAPIGLLAPEDVDIILYATWSFTTGTRLIRVTLPSWHQTALVINLTVSMIHCIIYSNHYFVQGREIYLSCFFSLLPLSSCLQSTALSSCRFPIPLNCLWHSPPPDHYHRPQALWLLSFLFRELKRFGKYSSSLTPSLTLSLFASLCFCKLTIPAQWMSSVLTVSSFDKRCFWGYLYWNPKSSHVFGGKLGYTVKDNGRQNLSTSWKCKP